jgi:hypothetical protein
VLKADGQLWGDQIVLLPDASIPAQTIEKAIGLWRRCAGYATAFPRFVVGEGGGLRVAIRLEKGSVGYRFCGRFVRDTIVLYSSARVGERSFPCAPLDRILAHELGHVLGLADLDDPQACATYIMSGIVETWPRRQSVERAECNAVSRRWVTSQEQDRDSFPVAGPEDPRR